MPTRSGRRFNPYGGRPTRSNTRLSNAINRPNTTRRRSCNECGPEQPAQNPQPPGRMYADSDLCKRHRKPDDTPKTHFVSGYRRR